MRNLRTPFFGIPEDAVLLGSMGDGSADEPPATVSWYEVRRVLNEVIKQHSPPPVVPSRPARGFMPHEGENRRTRRAAVANWQPPEQTKAAGDVLGAAVDASSVLQHPPAAADETPKEGAVDGTVPAPAMPTRRELWLQRAKHRRGKLDPELRRLQRERLKQK